MKEELCFKQRKLEILNHIEEEKLRNMKEALFVIKKMSTCY